MVRDMAKKHPKEKTVKDNPLASAFDSFNATVSGLGSSYQEIKDRIQELNVQISEKNRQLEENFYEVNRLRLFFDSILNSMTDGVIVVDTSGKIVLFNRGAEKLTGFSGNDVLGQSYSKVFGRKVSQRFSPLFTLSQGETLFLEEKELPTKTGQSVPVRYSTSLVADSQKNTLGAVEVFSDLSRIKQLEGEMQRIKTQTALYQMARLMTHEIRNPLGGIRGYVDLIAESFDSEDSRHEMIDHVLKSIARLDEIVANFQLFTRPVKPNFENVNVNEFVEEVLEFFQKNHDLGKRSISIHPCIGTDTESCRARFDPILTEQAIMAVLDNAVKAMRLGGTIRVEVKQKTSVNKQSKELMTIAISDSGEGMTEEVLKDLFTPFFTTREKGLGLGLSLARNFISLQRGEIDVQSEKGMGTTVQIHLPIN